MNSLNNDLEAVARPLLPRCLQHRAPVRYEIKSAKQKRLLPTLAGFRFKPGTEYRLYVATQDGKSRGWSMQINPPPKFLDWPAADCEAENGRVLAIRTRSYLRDHWLQLFDRAAETLCLTLRFDDLRMPYEFQIPIVLSQRWLYVPFLIGGALAAAPFSGTWRWVAVVSGAVAAAGMCLVVGLWQSRRRALETLQRIHRRSGRGDRHPSSCGSVHASTHDRGSSPRC